MRSTLRRGVVVAAGVAAALSLGLGSAMADPNYNDNGTVNPNGFLPDSDDLVGVGSDTTQFVSGLLARDYTTSGLGGTVRAASFDAVSPVTGLPGDTVTLRDPNQDTPLDGSGTPDQVDDDITAVRPNGSSQGVSALINNPNVDFARSSRPTNGSVPEQSLTFVPFAQDGLSYIVDDESFVPTNLSAEDLRNIYTCQLPGYAPKLPQAGSGTRAYFLSQISVTEAEIAQSPCVDATVQEHDPSAVIDDAFALAPFSEARFRVNPPNPTNPPSDSVVLAHDADSSAFYRTRDVYHVIRNSAVGTAKFDALFASDGFICDQFAAGNVQGFISIGSRCGY